MKKIGLMLACVGIFSAAVNANNYYPQTPKDKTEKTSDSQTAKPKKHSKKAGEKKEVHKETKTATKNK